MTRNRRVGRFTQNFKLEADEGESWFFPYMEMDLKLKNTYDPK